MLLENQEWTSHSKCWSNQLVKVRMLDDRSVSDLNAYAKLYGSVTFCDTIIPNLLTVAQTLRQCTTTSTRQFCRVHTRSKQLGVLLASCRRPTWTALTRLSHWLVGLTWNRCLLFHLLHLHLVIRFYWSYRLIFFICPTYDSIYVYICNHKDREAGSEENSQLMDSDPQSDRRPDQRFHGRKFLAKSPQNWTSKLNNLTNKPKWSPQNNPHLLICAPREICEFYSGVLHVCQYCSSIPLNMKRTIWQNIYHVFPIYKWPPCFQHYSTSFPPFFQ